MKKDKIMFVRANSYGEALRKVRDSETKLSYNELADLERSLHKYLDEIGNKIGYQNYGSWYDYSINNDKDNFDTDLVLEADISGDWKHDHLAFDYYAEKWGNKNGYDVVRKDEEEIGNSQEDSYESYHWIYLKKRS